MNSFQDIGAVRISDQSLELVGNPYYNDFRDLIEFSGKAHLILSGGADSQAMASWLTYLGVPMHAYTYVATWNGEVINANDVIHAQRYAETRNIPLTVVDFDLYSFYEGAEFVEVAQRYQCRSPQIAVHLRFMEMLETGNIVTGGESTIMIGPEFASPKYFGMSPNLFLNYHAVYKRFATHNGVDVHRNWFWSQPEIFWAAARYNLALLRQGICLRPKPRHTDEIVYKNRLYQAQGFDIQPLAVKLTGFEHLKRILASQTGFYDEYDRRYRAPLQKIIPAPVLEPKRFSVSEGIQALVEEFRTVYNDSQPTNVAQYRFDF